MSKSEEEEEDGTEAVFAGKHEGVRVLVARDIRNCKVSAERLRTGGIRAAVTPDVFVLDAVKNEKREERGDALFRSLIRSV